MVSLPSSLVFEGSIPACAWFSFRKLFCELYESDKFFFTISMTSKTVEYSAGTRSINTHVRGSYVVEERQLKGPSLGKCVWGTWNIMDVWAQDYVKMDLLTWRTFLIPLCSGPLPFLRCLDEEQACFKFFSH